MGSSAGVSGGISVGLSAGNYVGHVVVISARNSVGKSEGFLLGWSTEEW